MLTVQDLCGKRYNKFNSPELKHVFENNHIILLTETWTNDHPEIHVDGFEESVLNRTINVQTLRETREDLQFTFRTKWLIEFR